MTAENELKLSIRLLSNVALGRGSQIALDIVNKFFILILYLIRLVLNVLICHC